MCEDRKTEKREREEGVLGSSTACYEGNRSIIFWGKTFVKMPGVPLFSIPVLVLH